MPNWCENTLTIRGAKKDLEDFKQKITPQQEDKDQKDICLFNTFRPMPIEYKGVTSPNNNEELAKTLTEKFGYRDWYSWALGVWGTKWGCCDSYWETEEPFSEDESDTYNLVLHYQTAWSPGDDCLEEIFQGLDNLSFFLNYREEGMGFEGALFVRNGKTEYKECRDIIARDIESLW